MIKQSMTISIILHILIFKFSLFKIQKPIEQPISVEVLQVNQQKNVAENIGGDGDCTSFYGGVGIHIGPDNVIKEIYYGYVAQKSGLEVGDRVIPLTDSDISGKIGTEVLILVEKKSGLNYKLKLKREKICYE